MHPLARINARVQRRIARMQPNLINHFVVVDYVKEFREAEMELYVYYLEWELKTWEIGGSPWIMKKERLMFEWAKHYAKIRATGTFGLPILTLPEFEAEWDRDWDAVMID